MSGTHRDHSRHRHRFAVGAVLVGMLAVVAGLLIYQVSRTGRSAGPAAAPAAHVTSSVEIIEPSSPAPSAPASTPTVQLSSSTRASTAAAKPSSSDAPLTYTVKPGDNLFNIAAWFHEHGYGRLYDLNKAVIGHDPRLIHPGQKITISGRGITMSN